MDNRTEVREFLMSRRARIAPAAVGLTAGPNRRVAGLRRAEVAMLADVSVEYYAKLERGDIAGASASVLESLSQALRLDETERMHLLDLRHSAGQLIHASKRSADRHERTRCAARTVRGKVCEGASSRRLLLEHWCGLAGWVVDGTECTRADAIARATAQARLLRVMRKSHK